MTDRLLLPGYNLTEKGTLNESIRVRVRVRVRVRKGTLNESII